MNKFKLTVCIVAAMLFGVSYAEDTDCGALITTGNIADSAKVENLTGANAGKATITINDNSGTANSVTVYNAATVDTALSGKASATDVTALQTRAAALEGATNALSAAVSELGDFLGTHFNEDGNLVVSWTHGSMTVYADRMAFHYNGGHGTEARDWALYFPVAGGTFARTEDIPASWDYTAITNAPWLTSYTETDPTVPNWAKASAKPSYNFSEIGSTPTNLLGYGITDAKISNGVITLGSNTITPLTSFTETDPVWVSEKGSYSTTEQMNTAIQNATNGLAKASALSGYVPTSRKVAGKALTADVTLSNLSIVGSSTTTYNGSATASVNQTTQTQTSTTQNGTTGKNLTLQVAATSLDMGAYYIKIGTDGKPHLMLRQ